MAKYRVTLISLSPLRLKVTAEVPAAGNLLDIDNTYPAERPEMAANGWRALISSLMVFDAKGTRITVTPKGTSGWNLPATFRSPLRLSYEIDYSLLAVGGWSSPLESAFTDDDNAIVAGRSVFITTAETSTASVEIETPRGWSAVMPWKSDSADGRHYAVGSKQDLTNNMLVFSRKKPHVVSAAGFRMQIVSMGHWQPIRPMVSQVLKTIIAREVEMMRYRNAEIYTVVLLPISDIGGNAFRQSFVYCYNDPNQTNKNEWANTLAHEIFHYWNYARLEGSDYASSQWFQEGFTEYVANLVTVTGKIIAPDTFVRKLSLHVNNYRKLTTTLENYGSRKGPPLYSAGALVAFMWDIRIRQSTGGKRNIGDLFRNLMVQTESGRRKYTWVDIKAALQASGGGDWEAFYQADIKGHEPLPLDNTLPLAGLRLTKLADGTEIVGNDPSASAKAKSVWRSIIND